MSLTSVKQLKTVKKNVRKHVDAALEETGGLLRLAPAWVPRSFLQPGLRLKLHPDDTYAYGLNRGGIDERWFGSTTEAANEGRVPDEGLSYVVHGRNRFTLRDAVAGEIAGCARTDLLCHRVATPEDLAARQDAHIGRKRVVFAHGCICQCLFLNDRIYQFVHFDGQIRRRAPGRAFSSSQIAVANRGAFPFRREFGSEIYVERITGVLSV